MPETQDPDLLRRRSPEEQAELRWFREPRRSLLCFCASVALILALGLGGVGFLSAGGSGVPGEWRLGVGATLCLLSLALLLKQLLSSAIQDTNCVRSRRRIDQLKSGGRADPALVLVAGLAVTLCGTLLLLRCGPGDGGGDVRGSGLALVAAGLGVALAVAGYVGLVYLRRRRERTGRRTAAGSVRVFCVSGGRTDRAGRGTASGRADLN
ncbi:transmembrane protein 125 [Syngnathoides biaculeatus]|uniref:transmembrane protein 125 n=1 Tax=Syngnathoides biaculeatus TaxID=300417 RepID=UPI002ADE0AAB|nr:transmembrane protein 125 [Syngnathoides biaculeatus]